MRNEGASPPLGELPLQLRRGSVSISKPSLVHPHHSANYPCNPSFAAPFEIPPALFAQDWPVATDCYGVSSQTHGGMKRGEGLRKGRVVWEGEYDAANMSIGIIKAETPD